MVRCRKYHLIALFFTFSSYLVVDKYCRKHLSTETHFRIQIKSEIKIQSTIGERIDEKGGNMTGKNSRTENCKEIVRCDINKAERERIVASREGDVSAIAVLVMACNRVTVTRCLDNLLKFRPSANEFPIIVSQDCQDEATDFAIQGYKDRIFHIKQPDQSIIRLSHREQFLRGYYKIARHYGWALNQTFLVFNFSTAIVIEDDLDISPDLFEYFKGTLPLLHSDPTLWYVSAWNDNGKPDLIEMDAPSLLHRTDFFPGLGWMLTKSNWLEIANSWPSSYWDDWIRKPAQRKGRSFIRPEISRTKTFGKKGVSYGAFYDTHLKYIHLNDKFVNFTKLDLTYLLKDNYDKEFAKAVDESPVVSYQELKADAVIITNGSVKIPYYNNTYKIEANAFGLMDDLRSGIPRNAYKGVVSFYYKKRRVYLVPNRNWK